MKLLESENQRLTDELASARNFQSVLDLRSCSSLRDSAIGMAVKMPDDDFYITSLSTSFYVKP